MKRHKLIKILTKNGAILLRHGACHDLYINKNNGKKQPVPRHPDINERLAKHIIKLLGN